MTELVVAKGQPISGDPEKKGWLFKWTNYLKGYQRRWFVLSNGLLSYYRNQAEMAHTCRGTISLLGALIHTADSCTFVISNGGTQTFHIRAHDEIERQSWVTALEFAKAKAIRATESDEDEEESSSAAERARGTGGTGEGCADAAGARELAARFDDLRTCSELVARHGAALQRALADLEVPPHDQAKQLAERATLFRIACNAMMNACSEYMTAAQASSGRLGRALQHEREQKLRLQEVVEQLARQHDNLEKTVSARAVSQATGQCAETDDEEEHEFFDAQDESGGTSSTFTGAETSFIIKLPVNRKSQMQHGESSDDSEVETVTETQQVLFVEDKERRNGKMGGTDRDTTQGQDNETTDGTRTLTSTSTLLTTKKSTDQTLPGVFPHVTQLTQTDRPRRQRVPDKPNYPLNLWSIMKNCIGKELSKIPIPVNFSEPLSMLQRLTEDYEYSTILDMAARCEDACEQLAYIAAFTVSSYATTSFRTNKPFNPLLGETYECDRMTDLGWRAVAEQVSHHPPMVAQHVEGVAGWRCWQEFTMTSKFRGKYLQVIPLGSGECQFIATGNKYSWRKVTTTVHNIIVGKLWVDQHGDMDIIGSEGRAAGITCHLKYLPYSYFSKDTQRKVTGVVKDANGTPKWVIQGYWDRRIEIAPVTSASSDNTVCKTGKLTTVWESIPPPPDSDKWYNFTLLAAQLNEPEPGVAPTDSRHRPDQRLMEEGLWDEANTEKLRLEEKQRAKRREHERAAEEAAAAGRPALPGHRPIWFTRETVADNTLRHVYAGEYWQCKERQDWSRCPDIF